jgi:putative oxidoreductase
MGEHSRNPDGTGNVIGRGAKEESMLRRLFETPDEVALTIIRVTMGGVFLPHGLQKLFGWFGGHGPVATMASFEEWFGLPPAVTALVIAAESIGALFLIAGLASRIAAGAIGGVMIGAVVLVTGRWGFFMNWYSETRGEGFEYHLLILGMVLAIVLRGGGRWSVDRWLAGRILKARD